MKKPVHRYAVATPDPEFYASLKKAISEGEKPGAVVMSRNGHTPLRDPDLTDEVRRSEANVLVLDVGDDSGADVVEALRELAAQNRDVRLVVVGKPASAQELLDLMRAGVSDYLSRPVENGVLEGALERVTRDLAQAELVEGDEGRVIGFVGPKGGTGVTTTAANAALKLRMLTEDPVLLADLNAELGTAALLLGLRPRYNFVELVKNLHRLDEDLLRSYLTHHETGLAFLPSPLTARDLEGVTKQRINATMALLRRQFPHVVLDLGNSMTPLAQAGLSVCDEVVVVLSPEVPALRNAKRLMPIVSQSVRGGERSLRYIVNRYDGKVDIPVSQIRETLGQDVGLTIPRVDEESTHAANMGRPLVLEGVSKYEKALDRLGVTLAAPGSVKKRAKRGRGEAILSRLKGVKPGKGTPTKTRAAPPPAAGGAPDAPKSAKPSTSGA